MKTLGVTGGIGSGKSAVCKILADLGAEIFYADDEAKKIMINHSKAISGVKKHFGDESYHADGSLNRPFIAAQVFGDEKKLQLLNGLIHPLVYDAFVARKEAVSSAGGQLLVKEAALIFETGGDKHLDAVLAIESPPSNRIERVIERDKTTAEAVKGRMAHQLPAEELRRRANFVIVNDGSLADLRKKVTDLWPALL